MHNAFNTIILIKIDNSMGIEIFFFFFLIQKTNTFFSGRSFVFDWLQKRKHNFCITDFNIKKTIDDYLIKKTAILSKMFKQC